MVDGRGVVMIEPQGGIKDGLAIPVARIATIEEDVSLLIGDCGLNELVIGRVQTIIEKMEFHPFEMAWVGLDADEFAGQRLLMEGANGEGPAYQPAPVARAEFDHRE